MVSSSSPLIVSFSFMTFPSVALLIRLDRCKAWRLLTFLTSIRLQLAKKIIVIVIAIGSVGRIGTDERVGPGVAAADPRPVSGVERGEQLVINSLEFLTFNNVFLVHAFSPLSANAKSVAVLPLPPNRNRGHDQQRRLARR